MVMEKERERNDSKSLYWRGIQFQLVVLSLMYRDSRWLAVSCADSIRFYCKAKQAKIYNAKIKAETI